MADQIIGKWELVSSDKYDEFLKEGGVGMIQRNLASKAHPVMEWILKDGKWTQKTSTSFKKFEMTFVPGEEFHEELADGRKSKSIVTIEGNKLIHKQNTGTASSEVTRIFNGNEMVTTFVCGKAVATRVFKRV